MKDTNRRTIQNKCQRGNKMWKQPSTPPCEFVDCVGFPSFFVWICFRLYLFSLIIHFLFSYMIRCSILYLSLSLSPLPVTVVGSSIPLSSPTLPYMRIYIHYIYTHIHALMQHRQSCFLRQLEF